MGIHYTTAVSGEWIQPKPRGWRMKCCDCGLVHVINFRIVTKGKKRRVQIQPIRDNRATATARRALKKNKKGPPSCPATRGSRSRSQPPRSSR